MPVPEIEITKPATYSGTKRVTVQYKFGTQPEGDYREVWLERRKGKTGWTVSLTDSVIGLGGIGVPFRVRQRLAFDLKLSAAKRMATELLSSGTFLDRKAEIFNAYHYARVDWSGVTYNRPASEAA